MIYNKKGGFKLYPSSEEISEELVLKDHIYLDNDASNFDDITSDIVTLIKIEDKREYNIFNSEFNKYWEGKDNQIVQAHTNPIDRATVFAYFDPINSLTSEMLDILFYKLYKQRKKYICLWDWDRTISMEEGLAGTANKYCEVCEPYQYTKKLFQFNETYNSHDTVVDLDVFLGNYMNVMHNQNEGIYNGLFKMKTPITQGQYTEYLLGGKTRVAKLRNIFSLDNVKHCIISNSAAFNLLDDNKNNTMLVRGIFHEMGLSKQANNNILLLHSGSTANRSGGYTKAQFINMLTSPGEVKIPVSITKLKELSDYRLYQLKCFLNDIVPEKPASPPDEYREHTDNSSLRRTKSAPSGNSPNQRVEIVRSIDI